MLTARDDLLDRRLSNLAVTRDDANRAVWVELSYAERACFSTDILADVRAAQRAIRQTARTEFEKQAPDRLLFQVLTSSDTRTFSLGGDLAYFI